MALGVRVYSGVSLWLVMFLPMSGSPGSSASVCVHWDGVTGVWLEALGRKSRILNKPFVTVDTDPPFKGWMLARGPSHFIIEHVIFSCFKRGSPTTGDDQICFFLN